MFFLAIRGAKFSGKKKSVKMGCTPDLFSLDGDSSFVLFL
jgi:hypothetical protein